MMPAWGWGMLFGGVFMLLFWGALVALILWAISKTGQESASSRETPLEIAKRRYARGEITKEEFEQLKGELGS